MGSTLPTILLVFESSTLTMFTRPTRRLPSGKTVFVALTVASMLCILITHTLVHESNSNPMRRRTLKDHEIIVDSKTIYLYKDGRTKRPGVVTDSRDRPGKATKLFTWVPKLRCSDPSARQKNFGCLASELSRPRT